MKFLIVSAILLLCFQFGYPLSCLPCDEVSCKEVTCDGTVVKDACGCCPACSKQLGEVCGGPWNISGVCDPKRNLTCSKFVGPHDLAFNLDGTCQPSSSEGKCSYPYVFSECASACQPDCENRGPTICTLQCVLNECVCGPGFIRRSRTNRTCIPLDECPTAQRECEFPKIFSDCATACPSTCLNPYPRICTRQCDIDPCICPSGHLMRSLTNRTCILQRECEDFSFCEKSCPPLSFGASSCKMIESWSCWLDEWKCNTFKWKMEVEKWWATSCSSANVAVENLWEGLPGCHNTEDIRCTDPSQKTCDVDAFGCDLCQCADGNYRDPLQLLEIWKQSNDLMMSYNKIYKKAKDACVSAASEC